MNARHSHDRVLIGVLPDETSARAAAAAAQRGVTVAVAPASEDVVDALERHRPLRIDVIDPAGRPVETLDTEEQHRPDGTAEALRGNLDADDYERHQPGQRS